MVKAGRQQAPRLGNRVLVTRTVVLNSKGSGPNSDTGISGLTQGYPERNNPEPTAGMEGPPKPVGAEAMSHRQRGLGAVGR